MLLLKVRDVAQGVARLAQACADRVLRVCAKHWLGRLLARLLFLYHRLLAHLSLWKKKKKKSKKGRGYWGEKKKNKSDSHSHKKTENTEKRERCFNKEGEEWWW